MNRAALAAEYVGNWVAVSDDKVVVAYGPSLVELIDHNNLRQGRGVTIWYEAHPEEVQRWGVMDERGRICPNCYHDTEQEAQRWQRTLGGGTIVTRAGQHDPWVAVEATP